MVMKLRPRIGAPPRCGPPEGRFGSTRRSPIGPLIRFQGEAFLLPDDSGPLPDVSCRLFRETFL
jgi:hypothetical protein